MYNFGPGVVGGQTDGCYDGIQLTTHTDTTCTVACDSGYSLASGSTTVICAADASEGDSTTSGITCVENTCAMYNFGPGVVGGQTDGCYDGIQLTTHTDTTCTVACDSGYSLASGSTTVTCAADATDGDSTTSGITCV